MLKMQDLPLFNQLVYDNKIIATVVKDLNFSRVDFSGYEYKKDWEDNYTIKNFNLGNFIFRSVTINLIAQDVFVNLYSDDQNFFDNPLKYFEDDGVAFELDPITNGDKKIKDYRRKLHSFRLFDRTARLSIYKSDAYGCRINLTFIG
ncbi:hypothetical protein [Chitinophaga defluvii]|uniref:Uncharacterized protein n=1 Tax=Chitinophaga defluvii TaxID=3163343 RepID=A0ABV2TC96_9BACT